MNYKDYKDKLFLCLLSDNYHELFMEIINNSHKQGTKKGEIYDMFLEFFRDIQVDSRTMDNNSLYDRLADFMDGFYCNKGFRILPDEISE